MLRSRNRPRAGSLKKRAVGNVRPSPPLASLLRWRSARQDFSRKLSWRWNQASRAPRRAAAAFQFGEPTFLPALCPAQTNPPPPCSRPSRQEGRGSPQGQPSPSGKWWLLGSTENSGEPLLPILAAISRMGTNAVPSVPALIQCLNDPNENVARAAIPILGVARTESGFAALTDLLQSRPGLRSESLDALANFGDRGVPFLIAALSDKHFGTRFSPARSSPSSRHSRWAPTSIDCNNDPGPDNT